MKLETTAMNKANRTLSAMIVLLFLAGCTAPAEENSSSYGESEDQPLTPVPERLSFSAPTFDRDVDDGERHDLRSSFDGPVLMLWVAAGCSGCHDWTTMLSEELEAGNISNTTNIVSVHRYAATKRKLLIIKFLEFDYQSCKDRIL